MTITEFHQYVQRQAVAANNDYTCKAYTRVSDRIERNLPESFRKIQDIIWENIDLSFALMEIGQLYNDSAVINEHLTQLGAYENLLDVLGLHSEQETYQAVCR